jgi:DUF4097 and DUF4098 domain-containing protein YvlB
MAQNRLLFASASTLLLLGLLAGSPVRASSHHHGLTVSTDDHRDITDCSQIKIDFERGTTARGEQQFTVSKGDASPLTIRLDKGNSVSILGWDRADYSIKACKAAQGSSDSNAQSQLGQVSISTSGGRVTASGPGNEDNWMVYFIVQAPRNASLNLESENGEIALRRVSGTINARNTNGPIELRDCTGDVRAQSENGPIEFTGQSGDFHLSAQNGPIEVRLTGTKWDGAGLDAGSENGPLELRVPDGYVSGVSVESSGNSPFTCRAAGCNVSGNGGDSDRTIRMGTGDAVIRLHTVNGPVAIKSASAGDSYHHDDTNDDDDAAD